MEFINPSLRQKGLKEYYTSIGPGGTMQKQYTYRKMLISWNSKKPLCKFYYWRTHFYTSIEGCMRAIDRHYKLYKRTLS